MTYPESWHRHTPKGYDNNNVINKGLKIAEDKCCDSCSCKPSINNLLESQTTFEE